jgi:hypothetical protein
MIPQHDLDEWAALSQRSNLSHAELVALARVVPRLMQELANLRSGGCARDQGLTQFCAEVVALRAQLEELQANPRDQYHTMRELYEYRMLYNAHAANGWARSGLQVVKSWRHSDGEPCFGGGWFVVVAHLPAGQVSNHYEAATWDLFDVPEVERPPAWDGHTPATVAQRLREALADHSAGANKMVEPDPAPNHEAPKEVKS